MEKDVQIQIIKNDDFLNFNPFGSFINFNSSSTPYDCYYNVEKRETVLVADLPGVSKDSLLVNVDDNKKIIINGKRDCEKHQYLFSNRWCGNFTHQINLNTTVDPSNINVNLNDGLLKVTISDTHSNAVETLIRSNNNKVEQPKYH